MKPTKEEIKKVMGYLGSKTSQKKKEAAKKNIMKRWAKKKS